MKFTLWNRGDFYYIIPYPMKDWCGQQPHDIKECFRHEWTICTSIPRDYQCPEWKVFDNYELFKLEQQEYEISCKKEQLARTRKEVYSAFHIKDEI